MKALGHFKTITYHKLLVMQYCFRVGLIRQGLLHDMSKYSWTEFRIGMKYYTGTRSPNAVERTDLGYSTAWLHHKGRNKHHLEYWLDYGGQNLRMVGQPMPTKYMVEMCLDRIAACRVYHGTSYTDRDPLDYLEKARDANLMHPKTRKQVVEILTMLAEKGEKHTLSYIRNVVLRSPVKYYSNLPEPTADPSRKDATFMTDQSIQQLVQTTQTPFYLYSEERISRTCQIINEAFSWNKGFRQFFPVKATPTPAILKLLRSANQGVVCSSAAELQLCSACGFSGDQILFMPNYPLQEDLDWAAKLGCCLVMDGPDLIDEYARRDMLRGTIGLRINPGGIFRFGTTEIRLDASKFGFTVDAARACIRELQARGITSIGVHSYLAGNTLDPKYYPSAAKTLLRLAKLLYVETGMKIAYVNISGGLGIPYRPEDEPIDLKLTGLEIQHIWEEECRGTELEQTALYTELGRYVTGEAGILITQIQHVREGYRKYAGVNASAANLMRPMMYDAYHHISVVGADQNALREKWDVVGTVCENTDKFAQDRLLPPLHVGDILVVHDAGAHGHSMGYQYGGRLRCGEYLLHADGSVSQIRRAETVEDYLATAVF